MFGSAAISVDSSNKSNGQFQDTDNRNANVQEFSVSEISGLVKRQIEDGFAHIRVRAELGLFPVLPLGISIWI